MQIIVARVALSSAVYSIDKPYDYELAECFLTSAKIGSRVIVPFGRGNKPAFGFILNIVSMEIKQARLKKITHVYDDFPLGSDAVSLVSWMRSRYFCTFFEAAACMLPPGIWGKKEQLGLLGVVKDKLIKQISLAVEYDKALTMLRKGTSYEKRKAVIDCFLDYESLPEKELMYLTGASSAAIKSMCDKGILSFELEEIFRRPQIKKEARQDFLLSEEQQAVYEGLVKKLDKRASVSLLFGVTGSGKTEVYIRLIEKVIKSGRTAILLVPEIALTPQMVTRFYQYFEDELALMHSMLSTSQRYDEYKRVQQGKAKVIIGTRSAIFAPLKNIGVIIIDEEHEYSYKSDQTPRYSAIDIAKIRAFSNGALLVLGSATPSVESFYNAQTGKYSFFELKSRYGETPLPDVYISDMRKKLFNEDEYEIGSVLIREISENLENKEQSILFVNRRGNSGKIACVDCGFIPQCEHCSVALTYHSKNNRLMCHYCGYSIPKYDICTQCGSKNIKEIGLGTQRAEIIIKEKFPQAVCLRMDADTTTQRVSHEKILDDFANNGDILIGTQMVAKGLDFDNVTLVGVLDSDISLYSGDFRASERTFSLISQVVGRAGRRKKRGRAVIQTYSPEHPVIVSAARQDYKAFYSYEIEIRKMLELPPFNDIFLFTVIGNDENKTLKAALRVSATLSKAFSGEYSDIRSNVLGPAAPVIYKVNDRYKYNISFRGQDSKRVRDFIRDIILGFSKDKSNSSVSLFAEINPLSY